MKKRISLILALLLAVSMIVSCQDTPITPTESTSNLETSQDSKAESKQESTQDTTIPESSEPIDSEADTSVPDTTNQETEPPATSEVDTEPKGEPINLIGNNAGEEDWAVIEGVWSGTLQTGAGGLDPVQRFMNSDGYLEITSSSLSEADNADHGVGNYIGISNLLKPKTTYLVTVKAKFDTNSDHVLHDVYPDTYDYVFIRSSIDVLGNDPVAIENSDDFVTYTYTFKTGSRIAKDAYLQIGPIGVGDNVYWGAFCPGASLVIAECLLSEA